MRASEFDQRFDDGEDVIELVDWAAAKRVNQPALRVNVDFPPWVVESLDAGA